MSTCTILVLVSAMSTNDAFFWVMVVFAAYRLTYLLARENGPFDVIERVSVWAEANSTFLAGLLGCFYCLSVWASVLVMALLAMVQLVEPWLALAAVLPVSGAVVWLYDVSVTEG